MVPAMQMPPAERVPDASAAISEGIRVRLAILRLSGAELARRMDRPQSSVSRRLSGDTPWDVNELADAARALGVDIADLVAPASRLIRSAS